MSPRKPQMTPLTPREKNSSPSGGEKKGQGAPAGNWPGSLGGHRPPRGPADTPDGSVTTNPDERELYMPIPKAIGPWADAVRARRQTDEQVADAIRDSLRPREQPMTDFGFRHRHAYFNKGATVPPGTNMTVLEGQMQAAAVCEGVPASIATANPVVVDQPAYLSDGGNPRARFAHTLLRFVDPEDTTGEDARFVRQKDTALLAHILDVEVRHAAPEELPGLEAAVGAIRRALEQYHPGSDLTRLTETLERVKAVQQAIDESRVCRTTIDPAYQTCHQFGPNDGVINVVILPRPVATKPPTGITLEVFSVQGTARKLNANVRVTAIRPDGRAVGQITRYTSAPSLLHIPLDHIEDHSWDRLIIEGNRQDTPTDYGVISSKVGWHYAAEDSDD